jgi:hypothetical protein
MTLGVAILFGLFGFNAGKFDAETYQNSCFPYEIKNEKSFKIVGSIHNYGYTGGEIGAFIEIAYQIIMRKKKAFV